MTPGRLDTKELVFSEFYLDVRDLGYHYNTAIKYYKNFAIYWL
jgi:hypothetical protein